MPSFHARLQFSGHMNRELFCTIQWVDPAGPVMSSVMSSVRLILHVTRTPIQFSGDILDTYAPLVSDCFHAWKSSVSLSGNDLIITCKTHLVIALFFLLWPKLGSFGRIKYLGMICIGLSQRDEHHSKAFALHTLFA